MALLGRFLLWVSLSIVVVCAPVLPVHAQDVAAKASWDPKHAWVFSVGVLEWQQNKSLKPFNKKNRRDEAIVQTLINAGVPRDHVVFVEDQDATLKNIQQKFPQLLAKTEPGDTLFFYYCGHGWVDANGAGYFANYDATKGKAWSTTTIAEDMKNFHGANAIFTVDCCHSGSLADVLEETDPSYNFAVLTSAVGSQLSTSNWTFSQSILDCLQGHRYADANQDGATTFSELGRYVRDEMRVFEKQDANVAASQSFDRGYKIATTKFPAEDIPRRAEALWQGKWWPAKVIEQKGNQCKVRWVSIGWDTAESDSWLDAGKVRYLDKGPLSANQVERKVGDKVQVLWKGEYYKATIQNVRDGKFLVHYDGYATSWDEWIPEERIR